MTSSFPIAICLLNGNYPSEYWNLAGVTDITAPSELWWASKERRPTENGALTSEYLELDMGRVRSFNFLNFSILQKPIDIFIDYDVWGFDSGVKNWQPVTRLAGERFDDRVDYLSTQANPWKDCQFYFTNVKGDMLSTRYLRIRFERRNQIWPNATISGTFPWSVDVRHLRTARYAVTLNDARGLLTNQGKVVAPIVDPIRSVDDAIVTMVFVQPFELDEATVTLVGIPSDPGDDYFAPPPVANDGETYFGFYASNDNTGILAATRGEGGMIANVNGNGNEGATGTLRAGDYSDSNEVGHLATDLPGFAIDYAFFTTPPDPTQTMCWTVAVGTAASSGSDTTAVFDYGRAINAGSSTVSATNNFSHPNQNYVMTYALMVGGGATVSSDALLLADGWTQQFATTTDPTTNFTLYFYTRVALAGTGANYVYPNVTLSGSAKWMVAYSYLGTPSDPTGTAYVIDSGQPVTDPTPAGLTHGFHFVSTTHGP